jgi:DNA-binding transcriptional ArsR family regulator
LTTKTEAFTTKKTKIVGTKKYIDDETGEVESFNVVSIQDSDANFEKIWLAHILEAIDEIGNAKMKILSFLLNNRDKSNNTIIMTCKEIAEATGISRLTVTRTLQALEQHNIINRKIGIVFLNPDVMFKGDRQHRMNVLIKYQHYDNE